MEQEMPYFMTNKEWYRISLDKNGLPGDRGLVLTDKAPKKAIESYEDFYREADEMFAKAHGYN